MNFFNVARRAVGLTDADADAEPQRAELSIKDLIGADTLTAVTGLTNVLSEETESSFVMAVENANPGVNFSESGQLAAERFLVTVGPSIDCIDEKLAELASGLKVLVDNKVNLKVLRPLLSNRNAHGAYQWEFAKAFKAIDRFHRDYPSRFSKLEEQKATLKARKADEEKLQPIRANLSKVRQKGRERQSLTSSLPPMGEVVEETIATKRSVGRRIERSTPKKRRKVLEPDFDSDSDEPLVYSYGDHDGLTVEC
jgi:hypothetical protein